MWAKKNISQVILKIFFSQTTVQDLAITGFRLKTNETLEFESELRQQFTLIGHRLLFLFHLCHHPVTFLQHLPSILTMVNDEEHIGGGR